MQTDRAIQNTVRGELGAEEKLLWAEAPNPIRSLMLGFLVWLFAIPWTAFAIFWIWNAAGGGRRSIEPGFTPDTIFPLFGLPFVLIGLGMLSAPYWTYRKAQHTIYAITNKRILIIVTGKTRTVESYSDDDIGTIKRMERADGTGDVTFAQKIDSDGDGGRRKTDVSFVGIRNVRAVENLLRDTFKKELVNKRYQPDFPLT